MPKVPTIVFTANLLLREGLLHFLARTRYQVIAKPRSASDFVSIPKKSPMLLIIGSDGNSANAADVISSLSPNLSCARIVVLSTNGDSEVCRAAIRAGAVAYLNSSMDRDAFIKALDLVMACGVTILSEEAVRTTTPFENKTMVTLRPTKHGDEERVANSSPLAALAQLSQLADKSEYYQGEHCESLHYRAGVWTGTMLAGAVMRGGGCGGRSSLSCLTRSFCSAPSSV